ncbi:MAG: DUF3659 domain-containing protein [Cyclobacteriaceae bacterium]|nr:DUF3659 domain-containing protein [Cyclobacteriaceae bacterium SS2]
MKKFIFFSVAFLVGMLLAAPVLLAQPSNKTERQLHINKSGEVLDNTGTKLGYISKEDIVFNNQGKKLGFIEKGFVYDADGNKLGKAKKGGKYYNNNGTLVLTTRSIGDKCEILDPEGHKRGTVHKNHKMHACVTHCFFLEKQQGGDSPEEE